MHSNFACKITKKNPNAQIKFILFCHLLDFLSVIPVQSEITKK